MLLAIDPGNTGTGWALFHDNGKLYLYGIITPPKNFKWEDKARVVVKQLRAVWRNKTGRVVVEMPSMFGGARGYATASGGSLVKLTTLVGMIINELGAEAVEIRDWKGQLPKWVVEKRIRKILPKCKAKSHAIDAIGIGLYINGRF